MRWSISAHYLFRKCQRAFFFAQVMATHGKKDQLRREAYILKQLKSMYEWRGNLVHQILSNYYVPNIQNGNSLEFDELRKNGLQVAKQQYEFSEKKEYRTTEESKTKLGLQYCALLCHDCEMEPRLSFDDVCEHMEKSFKNLTENQEIQDLLSDGNRYLAETNLPFRIDNVSISAIADLIIKKKDDKLVLIDWKVGKSNTSNYSFQLLAYAKGILSRWNNVSMENLEAYEINLLMNRVKNHQITPEKISDIEDFILTSANQIEDLTEGKKYDISMLDDFNYANTERSCRICKFRSLCMRLANGKTHNQLI